MQIVKKKQNLKNKKTIHHLFTRGNIITQNKISLIWMKKQKNTQEISLKELIAIPKRKINLASSRNLLRRRTKEAFRKNRKELDEALEKKEFSLNIAFIYQHKEMQTYSVIENKIKLLLRRLIEVL